MTMKVLEKGTPFASDVEVGSGILWLPYKNIHDTVIKAIGDSSTEAFTELESCVRKYKPDFINFLNYRGKSSSDRELLKKAVGDGIFLRGQDSKQALHPQLVNETILLSDIFDINEFLALDLLVTADTLKDEYPGWARGLVAVLLYYEGRLFMIQTITAMVTAIPGRTWGRSCFTRIFTIFQTVLKLVFKEDMMDNLLGLFEKSETKPQLDQLDGNLALGDWRHRLEVNKLLDGIRDGISFIIFALSAQKELAWKDTLRLMEFLKSYIRSGEELKIGKSELYLLTAALYSITNNLLLPDFDRDFAKQLHKYLKDNENKTEENHGFHCFEIFEILRLNFHVMTHKAVSETNINSIHGTESELFKDEEDFYFKKDVFEFIKIYIFADPLVFAHEEYVVKKFHKMFTDFITYMPMKVKEMKIRSEDAAKTAILYHNQGFHRPANLPQDYENFLECLGAFYSHDQLGLTNDFFNSDTQYLSLNKLVRGACIDSPTMFVPNATLLAGLARSSPNELFDLLKQNGHNFSFEHFFESIMKYLSNFGGNQQGFSGPSLYTSEAFQKVVMDSMRISINPAEISGICAYLDLVKALCQNSEKVKSYFTNQKLPWIRVNLTAAKVRAIPREIRAKMISAAAAMIFSQGSTESVNSLWEMFYSIKLIGQENGDLKDELDEHETRLEAYPLTISMLSLLDALISARFKHSGDDDTNEVIDGSSNLDNGAFEPYVSYVRDHVLLKAFYRSYKDMNDRWEISTLSINILSRLLNHVPELMFQLLCGSPLLRTVLTTVVDCVRVRESSTGDISAVDRCSYACLNLVRRALQRQGYYLHRRELTSGRHDSVVVGMQELLMKVISETGRPEFMLAILKYIDNLQEATHKQAALEILALTLTDRDDIDAHLYAAVISDVSLTAVLRLTFINSLYDTEENEDVKKMILQIIRASVVHSVPNFTMLLLGVDKKVDFQNPGVAGYPRTVLHSILDNAPNLPDAFVTLLTLIRDSRLWNPLLRYLKTNQFFSNFLKDSFPSPNMSMEDIGYLLKCIAVELKTSPQVGQLAHTIIGSECGKFQEVLNMLELDQQSLDIPNLEFFDGGLVMQAMKSCEYFDPKLKIRTVRIDMLEALLKEEISKLEKNTVLRLRHTVHCEAKEIVVFARTLNSYKRKEAAKINMFDGWRQCLEMLVCTPSTLKLAGIDFVTSLLRILLIKVVGTTSPTEFFCRLAAETVLTLCAVMSTFIDEVNGTTLNVILNYICKWIAGEQSPRVRATLYAAVLHVVQMFKNANEAGSACANSFSMILDHLCKDCCQSPEIGKMQAMYLMGEIIRLTTARGLGGGEYFRLEELSFQNFEPSTLMTFNQSMTQDSSKSMYDQTGKSSTNGWNDSLSISNVSQSRAQDTLNSSYRFPSSNPKAGSGRSMDYLPAHSNIMTYMFAKGFLGNLVEAIVVMDDSDLVQLFSNQPTQHQMKSLFVFEAKMSLLCRFAATGRKAILLLMDINIVHKLADMHVFEIRYYQEEIASSRPAILGSETLGINDTQDSSSGQTVPTRKGIMESLFSNTLKLFHVMVDAAPKNILLVEQIWHFLTVHDEALSKLLSREITDKDEINVSCSLLVSLLAKIAKRLPAKAFTTKTCIMSKLMEILKRQAVYCSQSDFRMNLMKDIILFIYYFSNNTEALRQEKKRKANYRCRPVLINKLNHDMLVVSPEEDLTLGVMVKIVSDVAQMIAGINTTGILQGKKLESATTVLETGLTLIYFHVEMFLGVAAGRSDDYSNSAKRFREDFIPSLDNKLVKYISDAIKVVPRGEYIEMLHLRLRCMVHKPTN